MTADGLFTSLSGSPLVDREISDWAWLQAMLDVEREMAAAQARLGLIPAAASDAIAAACRAELFDPAALGSAAVASASPVVPLVHALTDLVPDHARPHVHMGATSQDIVDSAMSLVMSRALQPLLADLEAIASSLAALAHTHRKSPMLGRTLLQAAAPITFGLKAAGWMTGVDEARTGLAATAARRLALQLGGAAGTLAALGENGMAVAAEMAHRLALVEPALPWHTNRARVAELAAALGVVAGALGKVALDVLLLAQAEIAEVAEGDAPGHGVSSAMPHKRNPAGAILVAAASRRAPHLVAGIMAAMVQEHERAAGAWQAEWETMSALLHVTGGAAHHSRPLVANLHVDEARMQRNLDDAARSQGFDGADFGSAAALVDRALAARRDAPAGAPPSAS